LSHEESVQAEVRVARNAWTGILELAQKNDIDLIVMMTYHGILEKREFIGSTTWKIVQNSNLPVITLNPNKIIMKMTGHEK